MDESKQCPKCNGGMAPGCLKEKCNYGNPRNVFAPADEPPFPVKGAPGWGDCAGGGYCRCGGNDAVYHGLDMTNISVSRRATDGKIRPKTNPWKDWNRVDRWLSVTVYKGDYPHEARSFLRKGHHFAFGFFDDYGLRYRCPWLR